MILLELLSEIVKFILYSSAIVLISKYILAVTIRRIGENLKLKSKTVGSIAGYATSVPELLTVAASSINGLMSASMYNILSSNVINFLQYMTSIILNKNQKVLKNEAVKIDILLVLATILIPLIFLQLNLDINIPIVIFFILLYIFFRYIDGNAHKLYLNSHEEQTNESQADKAWSKSIKYIF